MQLERVRGDLHRAGHVAAVAHGREVALEVEGLGRGAHDRALLAADDRGDGAEQAGLAAVGLEQGADEEGGRRLAVGAGDADDVEGARGVAVEGGGRGGHGGARVADLDLGHAEVQRALDDERGGTVLHRSGA